MREILRFIQSIAWPVHAIGAITLIIWLLKAILLDNVTAPYRVLYDLSHVVEGLLASVISGYVFYILFALYPEYQSRKIISPFVGGMVRRIVGDCVSIMNEVSDKSGQRITLRGSDRQQIENAFSSTSAATHPAMLVIAVQNANYATWHQYFIHQQNRTRDCTSNLIDRSRFLDADVIEIITSISECNFFLMVKSLSDVIHMATPYQSLDPFGQVFWEYHGHCLRLARWHDKNYPDEPVLFPL